MEKENNYMKKSTLLSLLTAGAVIATSAGTFAAWDNKTSTVSFQPVTMEQINVTAIAATQLTVTKNVGAAPTATGTFTVNAANISTADLGNTKLSFVPSVKVDDTTVDPANYTLEIKDGAEDVTAGDSSVAATNDYTVTVVPADTEAAAEAMGNKAIVVEIAATLETK